MGYPVPQRGGRPRRKRIAIVPTVPPPSRAILAMMPMAMLWQRSIALGPLLPASTVVTAVRSQLPQSYLASAWTAGRYTGCVAYSSANAQPTDTWNVLSQHTQAVYDSTQGLQLTSVKDINNLTTNVAYSYDSSGNTTTQVKDSDESGSYTDQGTQKSTCTDSSTLPCMEEDGNTLLYSGAVSRTFYDSQGQIRPIPPSVSRSTTTRLVPSLPACPSWSRPAPPGLIPTVRPTILV